MIRCAAVLLQPEDAIKMFINGHVIITTIKVIIGKKPPWQILPTTNNMKPVVALREFATAVVGAAILVRLVVVFKDQPLVAMVPVPGLVQIATMKNGGIHGAKKTVPLATAT